MVEIESIFLLGIFEPFVWLFWIGAGLTLLVIIAAVLVWLAIAVFMNMHPFKCSGCGKLLDAGNVPPGTRVQCPKCQAVSVTRTKWKKYN